MEFICVTLQNFYNLMGKIANKKAIYELEREFWVAREKLRAFEKDLKVESQIWCLNFRVVMIVVIWRGFFYFKVVKVDVRHGNVQVCMRKRRSPVSIKRGQC
jgi:hypothetical protein